MKILAISDRPPKNSIKQTVLENGIDIIVTLGDLDFSQIKELRDINNIPKIGIYGNHCSGNYMEDLGIQNMHLKTFKYKEYIFGGIEGCVRYKEDKYAKMYTQEESIEMMKNFPYVDVMISHAPPRGINDEEEISHQGYDGLKNYLDNKSPKFLMHGHTYPTENNIVKSYKDTTIIYVYADKVLEI